MQHSFFFCTVLSRNPYLNCFTFIALTFFVFILSVRASLIAASLWVSTVIPLFDRSDRKSPRFLISCLICCTIKSSSSSHGLCLQKFYFWWDFVIRSSFFPLWIKKKTPKNLNLKLLNISWRPNQLQNLLSLCLIFLSFWHDSSESFLSNESAPVSLSGLKTGKYNAVPYSSLIPS